MASRSSHPVGLQISLVRQPLPSLGLADVLAYFLADANKGAEPPRSSNCQSLSESAWT
jgi:hypothetical protein